MPTFREAETIAAYVHGLVRRRALKAVAAHDEKLSKVFDRIAEGVRRDLRASGYTIAEVRAILEKHFGAESEVRLKIIEESIRDAAREARTLDRETFEAIFGAEEVAATGLPLDRPSAPTLTLLPKPPSESEDEPR
jgi:DNA-binding transcriptional MerR regulator